MPRPEITSPFAISRRVPLARIDALVSAQLGPARVQGNAQPAVFNRQVAMYLAKWVGGWSTTAIGRFYNGRDHSTVCYSVQRIQALREINPEVDRLLRNFEKALEDPQLSLADCPSMERPASIRLDRTRDDVLLNRLADRIVSRLVELLAERESLHEFCPASLANLEKAAYLTTKQSESAESTNA